MKRGWLAALMVVACGGNPSPPPVQSRAPASASASTIEAPAATMPGPGERSVLASTVASQPELDLVVVELQPETGPLREQLAAAAATAKARGLSPHVQMWAQWCAICKKVNAAIGTVPGQKALDGVYLVRVNTDVWGPDLARAGLKAPTIPTFYALRPGGRPSRELTAHGWGTKPSTTIVERLGEYFAG